MYCILPFFVHIFASTITLQNNKTNNVMKKLMFVFALIIFSSSLFSQALSVDPLQEVQYAIAQQVQFPQALKESNFNESVNATIKLLPAGKLEVVSVETQHSLLRQYVVDSIEKIQVPADMVYRAITLTLSFNFKVL